MGGTPAEDSEPTVLLVDDEPELLEVYELWLADRCTVRTADSGRAALEAMDETVDVVFLDRRMPERSGDEVLRELRGRGHDPPVAMLTAVDPDADIVELPFDDYLTKPVTQTELGTTIDVLLQRAAYDERSRELFALSSKRAALEASPDIDHEESDRYHDLTERVERIREELDDRLAELVEHDYQAGFTEL